MPVSSEVAPATPKYYEIDGALKANANKAWLLAFLTIPIALLAIGFAIFVRMQPPTVIRIGQNGEAAVLGRPTKGTATDLTASGTDEFLNEAFVRRFLETYLNYSVDDVDEHWSTSLNMMTSNLSAYTLKVMKDDNTRGKIADGRVQSVFHLREIDPVPGEKLTYLAYGIKDVYRLDNGSETTEHFVNQYRFRLKTDNRTKRNPDGLWIAEYSETPIDSERRDQILAAQDNNAARNGDQ